MAVRIEHAKRSDPEIARLVRELVFKMPDGCMSVSFINLKKKKKVGGVLGFCLFGGLK